MKLIQRPLLCAGLLGGSLLLGACSEESDTAAPTAAAAPVDPNLVQAGDNLGNIIKLGTVSRMELSDTLRVAGQVDFDEQRVTRIGATVTGRVTELTAMLGQQVKVGDTLAVQASWDPKAAKAKAEEFVDLRFVDNLKKSGFLAKLYGTGAVSQK